MHVFLDTDIGTDVDDALALGVLLGSPEIDLVGISTVYGDTRLRAQLASRLTKLHDPDRALPISAGESQTQSGRPIWWPGHEGRLHEDLDQEPLDERTGVDLLIDTARAYEGHLDVLAIGPLTNIAVALERDPDLAQRIRRLVIMGGDFTHGAAPEHNLLCDGRAAQRVFTSDLAIIVGGLDLTTQLRLRHDVVQAIAATGPFGAALGAEIKQWWDFHGHEWNNPHDPILAAWMIAPHLFTSEQRHIVIHEDGRSTTTTHSHKHTRLVGMDHSAVTEIIVQRIQAAGRAAIDRVPPGVSG